MNAFEWIAPKTPEKVSEAAKVEGAVLKAGGVDLIDRLKNNIEAPSRVVSLQALKGLGGISADAKKGLELGALVTLAQLAGDAKVRAAAPKLAEACWHVATPQIRNMATLGGNLAQKNHCWYFRSEHDVCRRKGGSTCFALQGDNEYHALFDNGSCASVHASTVAPAGGARRGADGGERRRLSRGARRGLLRGAGERRVARERPAARRA